MRADLGLGPHFKRAPQLTLRYRDRLQVISIGGYYMEGKTLADCGREMELYRDAGMAGCELLPGTKIWLAT